ncbi:MAG: WD40 repeat domain-containing protein [Bacteroidia bacterium]|nr:WD40 repeat domain-containing protein [Bacteroidia bacterium]
MERILILYLAFIFVQPVFAQDSSKQAESIILKGADNDINTVTVSPIKVQRMAAAGWNNEILIYKTDSPYQMVQKLVNHTAPVNSITYNLKGNYFASGGSDFNVFIYDSMFRPVSIQLDQTKKHSSDVRKVMFDKASKYVFSGDKDGRLIIWDINNKKPIKMYETGSTINSLCISPSPANIFVANSDKQIKLLALVSGKIVRTLDGHTDMVNTLAISSNGQYLLSGSNDKTARIWDLKNWKPLHVLQAESWKVTAVAFTDDTKYCATGSNDGVVKIWEVSTGKLLNTFKYPELYIRDISFSKDNGSILIGPKLKEGDNYGARLVESGLIVPKTKLISPENKSKLQISFDSIQAIRPLNRQDSIKFKSIINPGNLPPSSKSKGDKSPKPLEKPVIYKTPMKEEK